MNSNGLAAREDRLALIAVVLFLLSGLVLTLQQENCLVWLRRGEGSGGGETAGRDE